jgi:hypothetical protein
MQISNIRNLFQYLRVRPHPARVESLSAALLEGRLLASTSNIRPGRLRLLRANNLAYFVFVGEEEKSFIRLTLEVVFLVMCDPSMNEL